LREIGQATASPDNGKVWEPVHVFVNDNRKRLGLFVIVDNTARRKPTETALCGTGTIEEYAWCHFFHFVDSS